MARLIQAGGTDGTNDGADDSVTIEELDTLDAVTNEVAAGTPANPVHNCTKENDGTDTTTWSYVYFGSYPQSEVTDAGIKAAIDSAITVLKLTGSGEGIDVWVDGIKYRRIAKTDCNNSRYFDEVPNNGYRYFKWERIKWRVLQNDGSTLFVAADRGMDCKDYNEEYTNVTWAACTVRNWLNGAFYDTAFSSAEQGVVVSKTVINNDNPVYGTEGGSNTVDQVSLLSIDEVTNADYGFCSDYSVFSASRRIQVSDYARARGCSIYNGEDTGWRDTCWWWLRSPGSDSIDAAYISRNGYVNRGGGDVSYDNDTVVPILQISIFSDRWLTTDDGTSGEGGGAAAGQPSVVKVSSLAVTGISKKIAAGKKIWLTAEAKPADATDQSVTWRSGNTKYATVDDASGRVTVKKAGAGKSVTITATAADGSGVSASYKIKIMKDAVKSVKLSASSKTIKAGKSIKIKAAVKTTGKKVNKTLKWTSSNTAYATVNKSGKVTAKKAGKGKTVTITAQSTDGSNKKAKIKLKIK